MFLFNPKKAVDDLREVDFPAVAQFALSALKTMQSVLSPGDQYHLYSTSARALTTARRRGDNKYVEYWSGMPVMNVTIVPYVWLLPGARIGSLIHSE